MERALGMVSMEDPGCRFRKVCVSETGKGAPVCSLTSHICTGGSLSCWPMGLLCPGEVTEEQLASLGTLSPPVSQAAWLVLQVFPAPVRRIMSSLEKEQSFYPSLPLTECSEQSFKGAVWVWWWLLVPLQDYRSKGSRLHVIFGFDTAGWQIQISTSVSECQPSPTPWQ